VKESRVRKTTLVTGFEPFNGAALNPSQEIVRTLENRKLDGIELIFETLPCVFSKASPLLIGLIEKWKPDVVIALGQAEGRNQITPEKIAINLDDARIADNAGDQRINSRIIENGPDGLFSTLPIDRIISAISGAEIPVGTSFTAGTFLCNNVFYSMQHFLQGSSTLSGFIHVPLMSEQAKDFPGLPTMDLEKMVEAISIAITIACHS
jgi:pyroglutamyl-peptidase